MLITDTATISEPRMTGDGFMVVDARIARVGIQSYNGSELDRPDMATVRLYRPESSVFSDKALRSFAHRTVTDDHPADPVSAENWKKLTVGMTGDTVVRDGDHVRVAFTLMDAAAIRSVQNGKRELSCGYACDIDWTPGVTPTGEPYDASQVGIVGNHLAIVDRGRAGSSCRIGDSWTTTTPTTTKDIATMADQTRAVLVDGVSYTLSDQGAQIIERLKTKIDDAERAVTSRDGQIAALADSHRGALSAKDGEIAALQVTHTSTIQAKDGEIAALTARIPDAAAMDAAIDARLAVVATVRRALGDNFETKGKSESDMRRAVVTARLGDAAMVNKTDDFVTAAFDTLALADAGTRRVDPIRGVIADGVLTPGEIADSKTVTYEQRMAKRWKGGN